MEPKPLLQISARPALRRHPRPRRRRGARRRLNERRERRHKGKRPNGDSSFVGPNIVTDAVGIVLRERKDTIARRFEYRKRMCANCASGGFSSVGTTTCAEQPFFQPLLSLSVTGPQKECTRSTPRKSTRFIKVLRSGHMCSSGGAVWLFQQIPDST